MAKRGALQLSILLAVLMFGMSMAKHDKGKESIGLRMGFYIEECPRAEEIVKEIVIKYISKAPTLAAPILRMLFHDCFVRGCDASVLLNSTAKMDSEKEAVPNRSLRGYQVIDAAKAALESECPGVVSCADVLALATRDAVVAIGGPTWHVPTGRRDGLESHRSEVAVNIPSPFAGLGPLKASFASKGLDTVDLVALSGAHTIGTTKCGLVSPRLASHDVALHPHFAKELTKKCMANSSTSQSSILVELDPGSFRRFDNNFYVNLLKKRSVFHSDSELLSDPEAKKLVKLAASQSPSDPKGWFFTQFGRSMEKMSSVSVLTGKQGNVRRHCALLN